MNAMFALSRPFYSTEGGGGGAGDGEVDPKAIEAERAKWTPEQWQAEIGRVAKKEREEAATATANRLKAEREEEDRKSKESKDIEDATARGEFDKVKADYDEKITKLENDTSLMKTENKVLREFVDGILQEEIDALPEAIRLFDPGEDAAIGDRVLWLDKARKASEKMPTTGQAAAGARPRPKSEGSSADQTRQEVARSRRML